ncbi:MAG: DUF484 family protein [Cellvibrio sp.]|uniref:DUF484 family protein n=1 Tax=Cellvibrio sp. TaxID=1965322 RepID=UPI0027273959|nr:DUF484 family protein [Cellvibrio sp.]
MNPSLNPITEQDIADFLLNTPDFFERHAELLASVQLNSGHGKRAVSLQERQAEMLREKIKVLERGLMDMIRYGNENVQITDKLQRWTRKLLLATQARDLPELLLSNVKDEFLVPQVAIKVWDVDAVYADEAFAAGVSSDVKAFTSSLTVPYVGLNSGFEAASWLDNASQALSVALIPLRAGGQAEAFGLLVLASPDAQRFNASMGTDFLERIGDIGSAALSRLHSA